VPPELAALYTQACEKRVEAMENDLLEIADDTDRDYREGKNGKDIPNKEQMLRSKIRIESRQWLMARRDPVGPAAGAHQSQWGNRPIIGDDAAASPRAKQRRERLQLLRSAGVIFALIAAGSLLAGCGVKVSQSLADRCADIMQEAMSFAEMDIDKRTSESTGINKVVARVEGRRTDLPEGSPPRDMAAECEFDSNILTGFRWTKGGPEQRR
jgi:hypothetical protein